MYVLSALEDDRLEPFHQEPQSGEHAGRACAYDDYRLRRRHIFIFFQDIFRHHLIRLIHFHLVTIQYVVAGIYGTTHYPVFELLPDLRRYSEGLHSCCLDFVCSEFFAKFAGYFYFFHC